MASPGATKYVSKLNGARVLIIGGSSGIGFGVAEALIEHEASVIISSSNQDRVSKAVSRLQASYPTAKGRVRGFVCNLGSKEQVALEVGELFSKVSEGGKLDHVVYTANDALPLGKLEEFSLEEIQKAGMVRFFGPLIVAQQLRKHLKEGPASSYTMTTSGLCERPKPGMAVLLPYLTGLEGMSRALARDLAPIRVNLIGVGAVDTELWSSLRESGKMEAFKESVEKSSATGVFGKVEDVAESYLYVMKDKNITGSMIHTNGGGLLM